MLLVISVQALRFPKDLTSDLKGQPWPYVCRTGVAKRTDQVLIGHIYIAPEREGLI